jgi:hypothetical protein
MAHVLQAVCFIPFNLLMSSDNDVSSITPSCRVEQAVIHASRKFPAKRLLCGPSQFYGTASGV